MEKEHAISKLVLASVALCLFFACGCAHRPLDKRYPGPKPRPLSVGEEFAYPKMPIVYSREVEVIEETQAYTVRRICFPSSHSQDIIGLSHTITIDWYDVESKEGKTPVVIVLPIFGGDNGLAKAFASEIAGELGYAALIVHRQEQYKELEDVENINSTLRQMVLDHRQAIDWIESQECFAHNKIGVFGISMGGIKAALLAGVEDRIKATVIALAGENVAGILTNSKRNTIQKMVDPIMVAMGLDKSDFERKLAEQISHDPAQYAIYIDARTTLMIITIFDHVVPRENQIALRRSIGGPKTIYLPTGHYVALLYLSYLKGEVTDFFREQFED